MYQGLEIIWMGLLDYYKGINSFECHNICESYFLFVQRYYDIYIHVICYKNLSLFLDTFPVF